MRRSLLVMTIALLLSPLLAAPAAAQDEPSVMDVLLDLGVVEIVDVDSDPVQSVDGSDPPEPLITILGEGSAVFPLDQLDRDGDGVITPADLLGADPSVPAGEPIPFGSPDRPDLPHGEVILPPSFDFWEFSGTFRWNVVQLSAPLDSLEGVTEVGFYEVRTGLPLIEPVPNFNFPGTGFTTGTGLVDTADGLFEAGQIQTTDSGVPTGYASPYVEARWTTNGEFFAGLGTENPQSDFTAIVSNGTDPDDPSTFWWQPTELASVPIEVTVEDFEAAFATVATKQAASPESDDNDDDNDTEVAAEPEDAVDDPAEIVIEADPPTESAGDGFAWEYVLLGAVVVAGVTFYFFGWKRRKVEPRLHRERTRLVFDPADAADPEVAKAYVLDVEARATAGGAGVNEGRTIVRPVDFLEDDPHGSHVPDELRPFVIRVRDLFDDDEDGGIDSASIVSIFAGQLMGTLSLPEARNVDDFSGLEIDRETGQVFERQYDQTKPEDDSDPISMDTGGPVP
ncbi:MAG: hypothetical protein R8F63_17855 [Acidimicrobiales bacterium]|nr:hypothetical protein [Acidimicrobiales bacterium]